MKERTHDRTGYPFWVCRECGTKAQRWAGTAVSTYHQGTCGVCGELKAVTQPRDFGYPVFHMKQAGAVP